MRVAIIGGGASGMACAWMLDPHHEVTVFEAAPVLGGHIRTLGRNVSCPALAEGVVLDAGVIEFDRKNFPCFHRLLAALGVPCEDLDGGETGLFFQDRRRYLTPQKAIREPLGVGGSLREIANLVPIARDRRRFIQRVQGLSSEQLYSTPISTYLDSSDFSTWVRALLMYAYSIDFQATDQIPAALAVPMLRQFLFANRWTRIPGGVYTYIDRIHRSLRGSVRLSAPVLALRRDAAGVEVVHESGTERFDAVVIATPPGAVLGLLSDPTPAEARQLGGWRSDEITTVVHTDDGMYDRQGIRYYSEFDLFEQPGQRFGYNAYLNRLCGVSSPEGTHYHLAFHLDAEIDPARIIHRQQHTVPSYTVPALRWREEILRASGDNHTYYAGAWAGDGLHEGAVTAAMAVAERLGGRAL